MAGTGEYSVVPIDAHLRVLGVSLVSEWDTLGFLYRHATSLTTAAQIARLVGHEPAEVGAALYRLEELGLLKRSRASHGTRIYVFSEAPEPGRHSCFLELLTLAQSRAGRMLLLQHLERTHQEPRRRQGGGLRLV